MEEKKEFPKEEFLCFKCVLECSKTRYVFFPWLDPFFIVAGMDLDYVLALSLRYSLNAGACIHAKFVLLA